MDKKHRSLSSHASVQKKDIRTGSVGKRTLVQRRYGAVQRQGDSSVPGRGVCTEFGDYWIVPDGTAQCYDVEGEQITETEFAAAQATWDKIKSESGQIRFTETDSSGTVHAGFKANVLGQLGKLMSRPVGRQLLADVVDGGQTVTFRPSAAQIYGGANAIRGGASTLENADGTSGGGGTTIIQIDPGLTDDDVKVFDAAGNRISLPVFITVGHELIHARHNQQGRNRRNQAATDAAYSNREEEETIAGTGGVSENDLRREHGLTDRHGHGGVDTRPTP